MTDGGVGGDFSFSSCPARIASAQSGRAEGSGAGSMPLSEIRPAQDANIAAAPGGPVAESSGPAKPSNTKSNGFSVGVGVGISIPAGETKGDEEQKGNPFQWMVDTERSPPVDDDIGYDENKRPSNPTARQLLDPVASAAQHGRAPVVGCGGGKRQRTATVLSSNGIPPPMLHRPVGKSATGASSYGSVNAAADLDETTYWRRSFEALHKERTTAAEAQLDAVTEESNRRERALRKYVEHLEEEVERERERAKTAEKILKETEERRREAVAARKEAEEAKARVEEEVRKRAEEEEQKRAEEEEQKRAEEEAATKKKGEEESVVAAADKSPSEQSISSRNADGEAISELKQSLRALKRTVALYRALIGTTLVEQPGGRTFDCTVVNRARRAASKFRLTLLPSASSSSGDGEGKPKAETPGEMVRFEPLAGAENLPDFLRGAIEFESTQCPELMSNVLGSLFPEE